MPTVALEHNLPQAINSAINLLDFDRAGLQAFFTSQGEKPFRAIQVLQWMHQHGIIDVDAMTNLSKTFRHALKQQVTISLPEIARYQLSEDGTRKWLVRLEDGNCVETVFIPEAGRGTLCVSSQVGCALNCHFCSTGAMGFNRNLSTAEIIGQVWIVRQALACDSEQGITNVVMMGMGEPLLNYDAVLAAMNIMMDDYAYGLSKYRVTLSTSGVVPKMRQLAKDSDCALAVSLHAANDELRTQIMPINKKYPLTELMTACRDFFPIDSKRKITFEYTMLAGVNDQVQHAKQLITLLQGVPAKVNIIPFNPFPNSKYRCSEWNIIERFRDQLLKAGVRTIIRKTRGNDIDAACGQLVGDFADRTRRSNGHRAQLKLLS